MESFDDETVQKMNMKSLLQNSETFDAFSRYLLKEYSHEHLLAIIEMTQFKEAIFKKKLDLDEWNKVSHSKNRHLARHFIVLPDECPKSAIVSHGRENYKAMARSLWLKYVKEG